MDIDAIVERAGELSAEMTDLGALEVLTEADEARFEEIDVELVELAEKRAKIEKRQAAEERAFALSQEPANVASGQTRKAPLSVQRDVYDLSDINGYGPSNRDEYRGRALEAVEKSDKWELDDSNRERITNLLERKDDKDSSIARRVLLTGNKDYKTGWAKGITGNGHLMSGAERDAQERAMAISDSSGGYAIPFPIDPTLIQLGDGQTNPIRAISRVETITTDSWQGLASDQLVMAFAAEAAEVPDDTTTFSQPSVTAEKAHGFVPYSIEIGMDYPNLANDLAAMFADGKDRLESTAFATGSGGDSPQGIVTAIDGTTNDTASATTDVFAIADVYALAEALGPRYQSGASWIGHRTILNEIRIFGTAVAYTYSGDLRDPLVDRLLGKPVYENSSMDSTYGSGENNVLVYGDFQNYLIADRVGASMEYIPHLFATGANRPSGQRGAYFHWRVGADSINDGGFALLNIT